MNVRDGEREGPRNVEQKEAASTQFVCRAQPHCRCSGEDACDCARNPQTNLCVDCFEPMEEVEFATGEVVKVAS
jgi:hypothetical protein